MSRRFWSFGAALVVALAVVVGALASRSTASAAPGLNVAPWSGNAHDVVKFHGTGFAPGTQVSWTFWGPLPSQPKWPGTDAAGNTLVVTADATGGFYWNISPYWDLHSVTPGIYWAQFCAYGTSSCWDISFKVKG